MGENTENSVSFRSPDKLRGTGPETILPENLPFSEADKVKRRKGGTRKESLRYFSFFCLERGILEKGSRSRFVPG